MMNMKKMLALLLAAVLVLGMFPMGAMAEDTATVPETTAATVPETTAAAVVPETTPVVLTSLEPELCECGLAKDHEGDCKTAEPEYCECGLEKGHEGDCKTAEPEYCECGLEKGHEGECKTAEPEYCECGLEKGHEGECQKAEPEYCECGLTKGHEGECQKCDCGLVKNHEGDCQKAEPETKEVTVNNTYKGTTVEITGEMPENVELTLDKADVPASLMENSSIEEAHVAFSLDISLQTPAEKKEGNGLSVSKGTSAIAGMFKALAGNAEPEAEEWQPEEEKPVTVTMDVAGCEDGNIIAVFHEDDDGEVEMVGTYPVKDGKITFEAKGFSTYTGVVVYYEFMHNENKHSWYTAEVGTKIDIADILTALEIPYASYPSEANGYGYAFLSIPDVGSSKVRSDSGYTVEDGQVYLNPYANTSVDTSYLGVVALTFPGTPSMTFSISFRSNLSAESIKGPNNTLCILYDKDGKFYLYDEERDDYLTGELPYQTIQEAIDGGFGISAYPQANFYYQRVKILINKTYVADWEGSNGTYENWDYIAPDGKAHSSFSATIQRKSGFEGTMISVQSKLDRPLYVGPGITIDNKSPEGKNLIAIETVNTTTNGKNNSGLIILHGSQLIDSAALADGGSKYRGVGIYVHSTIHTDPEKVTELIENEGGVVELDTGCRIAGFADGILQEYGVTRLKNRDAGTTSNISVDDNIRTITLYRHNYIGKWDTFGSIPNLKIYLNDVTEWQSGDIILGSGYYWDRDGNHNSADNNLAADLHWSPVKETDNGHITFMNSEQLTTAMGIAYYNPFPTEAGYEGQDLNPSDLPISDPYPVLRFQKQSVYNVQLKKWYFTLGEAAADAALADGHEIVFYDSTSESGTIILNHNVTIRSSYAGELSCGADNKMVEDNRAGSDCTAKWNRTSGSGISIQYGATVTFEGTDASRGNANQCGTLTLDANGKGRVIEMWGGTTMNMEQGITLTNGAANGHGGAIYNVNGTVNITGGTISNNSATVSGDGIYQDGTFNLSGNPVFSGHADEDVYLTATATSDTDSNTSFKVITKAGDFTFTNVMKVTLGNSNSNLYDGRNVVESGAETGDKEILESDLKLFDVTNDNVGIPDPENMESFAFIYEDEDLSKGPNTGRDVLELDIVKKIHRGNLKIEKVLDKEDKNDIAKEAAFTFQVTLPDEEAHNFKTYQMVNNVQTEVTGTGKSGTVKNGGILSIEAGHFVIIEGVTVGNFEVEETGLDTENFKTPKWGTTEGYSVEGTIVKNDTVHVTCTNTKLAKTATLELTKTIVKAYAGDEYPTGDYTFTIDFGGSGASTKTATYTIDGGEEKTLTDGETITLSLNKDKLQSTAVFTMPVGDYTITEANPGSKFGDPTWTGATVDANNKLKVTGVLFANETDAVICQNNYLKQVGDLVITKTVTGTVPDAPSFVFKVEGNGVDMNVTITMSGAGTESITIRDLPLGTYTVTEVTGWSERYDVQGSETQSNIVVTANTPGSAAFTNARNSKWLTWDTHRKNLFDGDLNN